MDTVPMVDASSVSTLTAELNRWLYQRDLEVLEYLSEPKSSFKYLLNLNKREDILPKLSCLPAVLHLLQKAFSVASNNELRNDLMVTLIDSNFAEGLFKSYMLYAHMSGEGNPQEYATVIEHAALVLQRVFERYEERSHERLNGAVLLLTQFVSRQVDNRFVTAAITKQVELLKTLQESVERRLAERSQPPAKTSAKSKTGKGQSYQETTGTAVDPASWAKFREVSVCPTLAELNDTTNTIKLEPIQTKGKYINCDHYLSVLFTLLREDFVGPLRNGLREYHEQVEAAAQRQRPAASMRFADIRLYEDVHIVCSMAYNDSGIMYRVRFSMETLRNVRWENSKRLIFGGLVCLSSDNFKTAYFATIAERDSDGLKNGYVTLRFEPVESTEELPIGAVGASVTFTMVECNAFFEAYKHVLRRLQLTGTPGNELPFEKYLVRFDVDSMTLDSPEYLRRPGVDPASITYDLTPIIPIEEQIKLSSTELVSFQRVPILNRSKWPSAAQLGLESAQYEALYSALTNELAVLVGPPGTGKTFIGLRICEVLLKNARVWNTVVADDDLLDRMGLLQINRIRNYKFVDRAVRIRTPILLVCYTNHALDQFLSGIVRFEKEDIVRIGGRVKEEYKSIIEPFMLSTLRRKQRELRTMPTQLHHNMRRIREDLENVRSQIDYVTAQLSSVENVVISSRYFSERFSLRMSLSHAEQHALKLLNTFTNENEYFSWLSTTNVTAKELHGNQQHRKNQSTKLMNSWSSDIEEYREALGDEELTMSDKQAAQLADISILSVIDRWRLYRSCLMKLAIEVCQMLLQYDGQLNSLTQEHAKLFTTLRNGASNPYFVMSPRHEMMLTRLNECANGIKYFNEQLPSVSMQHKMLNYLAQFDPEDSDILKEELDAVRNDLAMLGPQPFRFLPPHLASQNFADFPIVEWLIPQNNAEKQDEDDNIAIEGEADLAADQRMLDDDFEIVPNRQRQRRDRKAELDKATRQIESQMGVNLRKIIEWTSLSDGDGFRVQKCRKSKLRRQLKQQLSRVDVMPDEKILSLPPEQKALKELSVADRWQLYRVWVALYRKFLRTTIQESEHKYKDLCEELNKIKLQQDYELVKNAKLIALTTTGAAKQHALLDLIQPRIVIVEEAAEILEAHIVSSLSSRCQHLILIGDHKQLRPKPNMFELERRYNLDLSVFERLINNEVAWRCLEIQHRMRPEIAALTKHFYASDTIMRDTVIRDHESVLTFEPILGVRTSLFFFSHNHLETADSDSRSHINVFEASFIPPFVNYLVQQGYEASQITILTMYTGQLFALRNRMPRDKFSGVRVTPVDSYQGEENDIIIISCVRSNAARKMGFVAIQNRILVALSRARKGLFVIGDFRMFEEQSEDWRAVLQQVRMKPDCLGSELPLVCQKHPNNVTFVKDFGDFQKVSGGGCSEPCDTRLDCGHKCGSKCHREGHAKMVCQSKCGKSHCGVDGHVCAKPCRIKDYHRCEIMIEKLQPRCQHTEKMQCCVDPEDFTCPRPSEKRLPCGHLSSLKCGESMRQEDAKQPCTGRPLKCLRGHETQLPCLLDSFHCTAPCGTMLPCKHKCLGKCGECLNGRLHKPCSVKVAKELLCGHGCKDRCSESCRPCSQPCPNRCRHKTKRCGHKCGEECQPCTAPCEYRCEHQKCSKLCWEACDRPPCDMPCSRTLECQHPCLGFCGELCPPVCRICDPTNELFEDAEPEARFVYLADCKHVIESGHMDVHMKDDEVDADFEDNEHDESEDGSRLTVIKLKTCPICLQPIWQSDRYKQQVNTIQRDIETAKRLLDDDRSRSLQEQRANLERKLQNWSVSAARDNMRKRMNNLLSNIDNQSTRIVEDSLMLLYIETTVSFAESLQELQKRYAEFDPQLSDCVHLCGVAIMKTSESWNLVTSVHGEASRSLYALEQWLSNERTWISGFECEQFIAELTRLDKLRLILLAQHQYNIAKKAVDDKKMATINDWLDLTLKQLRDNVYEDRCVSNANRALHACECLLSDLNLQNLKLPEVRKLPCASDSWAKCQRAGHVFPYFGSTKTCPVCAKK